MSAVLLDIEGTTTDKRFVTDVLFPFARERMEAFLEAHEGEPAVADALVRMRTDMGRPDAPIAAIAAELRRWIDEDLKREPLKGLQGLIWRGGYEAGTLKAHVYSDVPGALTRWTANGEAVAIFSSGSVPAQKLLFGHTQAGDLTPMLSGYFDLSTGAKTDPASYIAIARALDLVPGEVRFYSDMPGEISAALSAGMTATLVERDGPTGAPQPMRRIPSFTDEP